MPLILPAANPSDTNKWRDWVYGRETFGPNIRLIRAFDPQSKPPVPRQRHATAKIYYRNDLHSMIILIPNGLSKCWSKMPIIHNRLPIRRTGKLLTKGTAISETAMMAWEMESSANFRHPPSPGFWVKKDDPKRYPTNNEEATVPAALTLYIVAIVRWSTPTCL